MPQANRWEITQGRLQPRGRYRYAQVEMKRLTEGHRARRQLNGLSLDPSARWTEAVKEAQYRSLTTPRPRQPLNAESPPEGAPQHPSRARQNWRRVSGIARRAQGEGSTPEFDSSSSSSASGRPHTPAKIKERRKRRRKEEWKGKMMDLSYFLEMVDLKHRYGSHLRAYHAEWMRADTNENFFYWLDYGEGRNIDLQLCSRDRLDREQVRYLNREERMDYLVEVDKEGRLCWKRNGARIDTSEEWRDSIHGIVPRGDDTPMFRAAELEGKIGKETRATKESSDESEDDEGSDSEDEGEKRYADSMTKAKGPKKILHVSPATILNSLLRKSVKKNTWIFVADTSMNLYVGIKQSGAFQHSSFLHGSRISAAGLIKIKRGQLRSLSPLSGHYRPPASAFRHFIAHLRSLNVDMSRVSISKSYAVLVGLESYMRTKKSLKGAVGKVGKGLEKVMRPEEVKKREEEEADGSMSARREKEVKEEEGLRGGLRRLGVGVGHAGGNEVGRAG